MLEIQQSFTPYLLIVAAIGYIFTFLKTSFSWKRRCNDLN